MLQNDGSINAAKLHFKGRFVTGHGLSRAVTRHVKRGFNPCGRMILFGKTSATKKSDDSTGIEHRNRHGTLGPGGPGFVSIEGEHRIQVDVVRMRPRNAQIVADILAVGPDAK